MSEKLRFAPSPTGNLHVGNIRLALFNWLYAYRHDGNVLLRFDDTDQVRSQQRYIDSCRSDLDWLGMRYQAVLLQSQRLDRYQQVLDSWREQQLIYPCFETPEELQLQRNLLRKQGKPPVYQRAALRLSAAEIEQRRQRGDPVHWRFLLNQAQRSRFQDLVRGEVNISLATVSDPVIVRGDNRPLYTFTSVVDDCDYGITAIIRGEDHVTNTAVQLPMLTAMLTVAKPIPQQKFSYVADSGGQDKVGQVAIKLPKFAHISLIVSSDGSPLSKRDASFSIGELRSSGIEPVSIINYLADLGAGTTPRSEKIIAATQQLRQLGSDFSLTAYSRNTPRFDVEELINVNSKLIANLSYPQLQQRAKQFTWLNLKVITELRWSIIAPEIKSLTDLRLWQEKLAPDYAIPPAAASDHSELSLLLEILQQRSTWQLSDLRSAIKQLLVVSSKRGAALFKPIRLALLATASGPAIPELLLLLGRDLSISRLQQALK